MLHSLGVSYPVLAGKPFSGLLALASSKPIYHWGKVQVNQSMELNEAQKIPSSFLLAWF